MYSRSNKHPGILPIGALSHGMNLSDFEKTSAFKEIQSWLAILNQEYALPCNLALKPSRGGAFQALTATITIGIKARNPLQVFIHEFAHALDCSRGGNRHGHSFYLCLREVAHRVLGSDRTYEWHHEYIKVWDWANCDGLTQEPSLRRLRRDGRIRRPRARRRPVLIQLHDPSQNISPVGIVTGGKPFRGDEAHAVIIGCRGDFLPGYR